MDIISFLVGILVGALITYVATVCRSKSPEEEKIERIDARPAFREERHNTVAVTAQTEIPNEFVINDPQRAVMELKYELGEAVWRYAMVQRVYNPREMAAQFRAVLKVVDMGMLNPYWREGGCDG